MICRHWLVATAWYDNFTFYIIQLKSHTLLNQYRKRKRTTTSKKNLWSLLTIHTQITKRTKQYPNTNMIWRLVFKNYARYNYSNNINDYRHYIWAVLPVVTLVKLWNKWITTASTTETHGNFKEGTQRQITKNFIGHLLLCDCKQIQFFVVWKWRQKKLSRTG